MLDPDAVVEIEDTRILEAFKNPIRVRLLRVLRNPHSVKEMATRLDVPPTRLYHHVNLLEEVGIIEVVETRKVGAMIEKLYQRNAGSLTLGERLVRSTDDIVELARLGAAVVIDPSRVDAEVGLVEQFGKIREGVKANTFIGDLSREVAYLTPDQVEVVRSKLAELTALISEMDRNTEGGTDFALTYVFFPIVDGGVR